LFSHTRCDFSNVWVCSSVRLQEGGSRLSP
jgi:hypothetical protein